MSEGKKISAFTEMETPQDEDLLITVTEVGGTLFTRKIQRGVFLGDKAAKTQQRALNVRPFKDDTLVVGNGKFYIVIPSAMDGWKLSGVSAVIVPTGTAPSGGPVTIMIRNATQSVDMLSTAVTIDATETRSADAVTQPMIDTNNNGVSAGDVIAGDFDAVNSAKDVIVVLEFEGEMD